MAKANYHQIRRQKELARKTRQQEKQQKRQALKGNEPGSSDVTAEGPTDSELIAAGAESPASIDQPVADTTGSAGGQGPARS